MADMVNIPVVTKKGKSRKALKPKNTEKIEILSGKENSSVLSGKKNPYEEEIKEMREKMEKMSIEKAKMDEELREKDAILKEKEAEILTRGKENQEMKGQIMKLKKMKEFKPTMSLPVVQCVGDKEQNKKEKKKGGAQLKKPSTVYALWCKDQWDEVKKENLDAGFGELANILGAKWKTVTDEEKRPYEEKYQVEKKAYLKVVSNEKRENEAMKLLEGEQKQKTAMELLDQYLEFKQNAEKDNKKTKKEKDPLKPKKPMAAFFVFINERRPELRAENKTMLEVSKITGEEWKNMTEEQKRPYEEVAKQNKEKYMVEIEAYKQKKEEEALALKNEEEEIMKIRKQEAMELLRKKEKADNIIKKTKVNRQKIKKKESKVVDPNRPKKPASLFLLFSKQARKDLSEDRQGMSNSAVTALISVKWKELSKEEKQVWKGKATEAMEAYKKDLETHNKSEAAKANTTQE